MGKAKYVLRLDDASPYMAREKWARIEQIVNKYDIRPIVGIVPACEDELIQYEEFDNGFFKETVPRWRSKHWTIAQHGLRHVCKITSDGLPSEFAERPFSEQSADIKKGYDILCAENCRPTCFFAPCHTFDENTVRACKALNVFDFISDGCAFVPYTENGVKFLPNLFDTPKRIFVRGVFTFVCHPSNCDENYFDFLDNFLSENFCSFIDAAEYMRNREVTHKPDLLDKTAGKMLDYVRKIRKGK